MLQTGLSLKTRLSLYLALTLTKKNNFEIFFQKIKSTSMPVHNVKWRPAASTYIREKGILILTQFLLHPVWQHSQNQYKTGPVSGSRLFWFFPCIGRSLFGTLLKEVFCYIAKLLIWQGSAQFNGFSKNLKFAPCPFGDNAARPLRYWVSFSRLLEVTHVLGFCAVRLGPSPEFRQFGTYRVRIWLPEQPLDSEVLWNLGFIPELLEFWELC